jgi:hypothetical protein
MEKWLLRKLFGTKRDKAGENYIMRRSFIICTP